MSYNICPECKASDDFRIDVKKDKHIVKGEPISFESNILVCNACESEVYDEKLDTQNLINAYDIYREKHNLLLSADIVSIRKKYDLSQISMSKLLGWGNITLHRYESGAIQDYSFDKMLRLVGEPENMMRLIESNKSNVSKKIIEQLNDTVKALMIKGSTVSNLKRTVAGFLSRESQDLDSGYRPFSLDRLNNMILFFASGKQGVLKTKLNKLLWYADFLCFKEYSLSCSGAHYTKLIYGPAPDDYRIILSMMEYEKLISFNEVLVGNKEGTKIKALSSADLSIIEASERKVLQYISERFQGFSSTRIMKMSHDEDAYKKSKSKQIVSYELAHTLSLSLPKN